MAAHTTGAPRPEQNAKRLDAEPLRARQYDAQTAHAFSAQFPSNPAATLINSCIESHLLDAARMVATLESDGIDTRLKVLNHIISRKEETFPLLANIATGRQYWEDPPHSAWAPICAIHLLAKMEHYRAQLAIITAILEFYEYTDDWLTEDAPYVLAHMGTGAIRTLTGLMRYKDTDKFVRGEATRSLVMIAKKNQNEKPGIIASIKDAAQNETDIYVRSLLVDSLLDLREPSLREYLENSLKTGFIRDDFFSLENVDRVYAGKMQRLRNKPRDPLYIFENKNNPYKRNR